MSSLDVKEHSWILEYDWSAEFPAPESEPLELRPVYLFCCPSCVILMCPICLQRQIASASAAVAPF